MDNPLYNNEFVQRALYTVSEWLRPMARALDLEPLTLAGIIAVIVLLLLFWRARSDFTLRFYGRKYQQLLRAVKSDEPRRLLNDLLTTLRQVERRAAAAEFRAEQAEKEVKRLKQVLREKEATPQDKEVTPPPHPPASPSVASVISRFFEGE